MSEVDMRERAAIFVEGAFEGNSGRFGWKSIVNRTALRELAVQIRALSIEGDADAIKTAIATERARCAALATSLASALPRADRECAVLIMRLAETMEAG